MVDVEVLQAMYPAEIKATGMEEGLKMTKADTECAQALLELARSFATTHPVNKENVSVCDNTTPASSFLNMVSYT